MKTKANIVVVGGGIVGCSVLYHLTRLNCPDVILIEKNHLTSGSTWHAAGNVTFFGHYPSITKLYVDSIKTYPQAQHESGISFDFHDVGSLRLATNELELDAYRNLIPIYQNIDAEYHVVTRSEIESLHPLMNTEGLLGAAYTPGDGHVDPNGATHALAKAATLRNGSIELNCEVTHIEKQNNNTWKLSTSKGVVTANQVVLATSFWARDMGKQLDLNWPLIALEHHEVITDSIPEIADLDFELPTVRDPTAPANYRQERDGILCGVYESNPKPWAVNGVPPEYGGELFSLDFGIIEPHLEKVIDRVPVFGTAGIKTIYNGPICYTPDGLPLLGPVKQMPGLWLAAGFCVGIGTGGESGSFLSEWIVNGKPPYALPAVYPSRYATSLPLEQIVQTIVETYSLGYTLPEIPEN